MEKFRTAYLFIDQNKPVRDSIENDAGRRTQAILERYSYMKIDRTINFLFLNNLDRITAAEKMWLFLSLLSQANTLVVDDLPDSARNLLDHLQQQNKTSENWWLSLRALCELS